MLVIDFGTVSLHVSRTHLGTLAVWRDRAGRSFAIVVAGVA
jgi:hypothetical protein